MPRLQASTPRLPHVMFLTKPSSRLAIFIACYVARVREGLGTRLHRFNSLQNASLHVQGFHSLLKPNLHVHSFNIIPEIYLYIIFSVRKCDFSDDSVNL